MPGPGGESAASMGGHGHMRVSRADRERTVDVLKAAFVHERLTEDELDDRVGRALAARTYADLDALTADIPAEPDQAPSPGSVAAPVRRPGSLSGSPARNRSAVRAVKIGASGVAAVTVGISVAVGVLVNPAVAVVVAVFFLFLGAVAAGLVGSVIAAAVKLESRQRSRSRGNTPPPPRAAVRHEQSGVPAGAHGRAATTWQRSGAGGGTTGMTHPDNTASTAGQACRDVSGRIPAAIT